MSFISLSAAVVLVLLYYVKAQATRKCDTQEDCGYGLKCCDEVCRKWRYCSGKCEHERDCNDELGENCVKGKCKCLGTTCNDVTFPDPVTCLNNADCKKDEVCNKQSLCVKAHSSSPDDSTTSTTSSWRTVIILLISILVAVILVALFIRYSFRARAERRRGNHFRNRGQRFAVSWRNNMASSATHNHYDYESAATNITIDLHEANLRRSSSGDLAQIDDIPPSYDTAQESERPRTPPPSYDEAVSVADGNCEFSHTV